MKAAPALLLSLLLSQVPAPAGGKSAQAYVGLHVQGDEFEGEKFVRPNVINGQTKYFRIMPEVVTRHFSAFQAFMAQDGASYGVALRLNEEGLRAMDVTCVNNRGRLARIIVNGKLLDVVQIDNTPGDGYIIAWSGLDAADLKILGKKMKRLDDGMPGEEQKKGKR